MFQVAREHDAPEKAKVVLLSRAATLRARVLDVGRAPLAEGAVCLWTEGSRLAGSESRETYYYPAIARQEWRSATDPDGTCVVAELPPDVPLHVEILRAGDVVRKDLPEVELRAGEVRYVEWNLGTGCRLVGSVVDQDGRGVAGQALWLQRATHARARSLPPQRARSRGRELRRGRGERGRRRRRPADEVRRYGSFSATAAEALPPGSGPTVVPWTASCMALRSGKLFANGTLLRIGAGLALSSALASAQAPQEAFAWRGGERVALVGNALAERMQHDGWLESALVCVEQSLSLRNLGFSGDEFDLRQRTDGFGSPEEWLERVRADVVFAFFGYGESFRDEAALAHLADDFARWLEGLRPRRVVVFSAVPREGAKGRQLPDPAPFNARLARVNAELARACKAQGVPFVDLYTPFSSVLASHPEALTVDGVHLTSEGNRILAEVLLRALLGARYRTADPSTLERVRALVLEKGALWFQRYQATDGYNVYGGRSALRYTGELVTGEGGQDFDQGLSNFDVLQRELEQLDAACAHLDARIQAAARGETSSPQPPALPPAIPVPTNRPGPHEFIDGEAAIARMQLAPGLEARLFASEAQFPELAKPVQMAFDTRGRLWVATWPSYPHPTPFEPRPDKLLIVEDRDADGRAERVVVFADQLVNPTGFEFWNGGVLLASCPDILFLKDTDGDDRCDVRERVLHGLSSADTHHSANSFVLGPEGGLYFQEGVFHRSQVESIHGVIRNRDAAVWRFDPRSFRVERWVAYGFANPHGHVFDRWGSDLVTDGTGNENYDALPLSGELTPPAQHPRAATIFPQRSRPAAATEILSSSHFPPEYQGNYLVANVIGFQGVFRYALEEDGSSIRGREEAPLLFSSDPSFRPVDLEVGPDGAVWLLDWYTPLIGHMQHHLRDPSRDHAHGRVYRVVCKDRPLLPPPSIAGATIVALLEYLKSAEDRVRYRARIELSGRNSKEVVATARGWARAQTDVHAQLEGLWVQSQHGVLDLELARTLLGSREPRARAAALRVVRHQRRIEPTAEELCAAAVLDEHPRVRLEAVVALSHFPSARAGEAALRVLERARDSTLDYALRETLRQLSPHWRAELSSGRPFAADNPAGLAHALALLDDAELDGVAPGVAVWRELLARPSTSRERALAALDGLAAAEGTGRVAELLAAIARADARSDAHADHVLAVLFALARELEAAPKPSELLPLVEGAARASTRLLALALCLEERAMLDELWRARAGRPADLAQLFEAGAHVQASEARAELVRHAGELLAGWRPAAAGDGGALAAQAAARLLGTLGAERADTLERLVSRFDVDELRPALVQALRAIPLERWPEDARQRIVAQLHAALAPGAESGAESWALAEELAARTEGEAARALLELCQRARPKVIVLRPLPDSLLFDQREIAVLAGRPIELTFENVDIMPHNWVLAAVGALAKVGLAAEAMAADPNATSLHFVPRAPEVLQATRLLQPGQSQKLEFRAPDAAGDDPFVCTFPGHWTRMNGVLRVAGTPAELAAIEARVVRRAVGAPAAAPPGAPRSFVRDWRLAELEGDLARVQSASKERGRALLEQASCLKCHASGESNPDAADGKLGSGSSPRTGPALADAVRAHAGARELLQSILEPSARIREGYASELFFLHDGRIVAGRVIRSEPGLLLVQDDPYRDDLLELPLSEIEERRANPLSTMPSGLFSTFRREEILELLAYLESLRQ